MPAPKGNKYAAKEGPDTLVVSIRLNKAQRQKLNEYLSTQGKETTDKEGRAQAREWFFEKFNEALNNSNH